MKEIKLTLRLPGDPEYLTKLLDGLRRIALGKCPLVLDEYVPRMFAMDMAVLIQKLMDQQEK